MVEERESPSAGWREVYDEMGVGDHHEERDADESRRCPDCGLVLAREEEHRCSLAEFDEVDEDVSVFLIRGEGDD